MIDVSFTPVIDFGFKFVITTIKNTPQKSLLAIETLRLNEDCFKVGRNTLYVKTIIMELIFPKFRRSTSKFLIG